MISHGRIFINKCLLIKSQILWSNTTNGINPHGYINLIGNEKF